MHRPSVMLCKKGDQNMWKRSIVVLLTCFQAACVVNTDSVEGLACWDLNGNGAKDASEDVNSDGMWDARDCAGQEGHTGMNGPPGVACWDLNGDNIQDTKEDINNDGAWNTLDCTGAQGNMGAIGSQGPPGVSPFSYADEALKTDIYYNGGKVGIGTKTPDVRLHVAADDSPLLTVERTGGVSDGKWSFAPNSSGLYLFDDTGAPAGTGPLRLLLSSNGNVGVGTNNPIERLDVAGSIQAKGRFVFAQTKVGSQQYEWYNDDPMTGSLSLYNRTADNYSISVASSGNVGIGTTSPQFALDVVDNSSQPTASFSNTGNGLALMIGSGGLESAGNALLAIDPNAKVGIGTIAPKATLDINGAARLAKYAAPPLTCDQAHDGTIALTTAYYTCACNGGSSHWVRTSDGTTSCLNWP